MWNWVQKVKKALDASVLLRASNRVGVSNPPLSSKKDKCTRNMILKKEGQNKKKFMIEQVKFIEVWNKSCTWRLFFSSTYFLKTVDCTIHIDINIKRWSNLLLKHFLWKRLWNAMIWAFRETPDAIISQTFLSSV